MVAIVKMGRFLLGDRYIYQTLELIVIHTFPKYKLIVHIPCVQFDGKKVEYVYNTCECTLWVKQWWCQQGFYNCYLWRIEWSRDKWYTFKNLEVNIISPEEIDILTTITISMKIQDCKKVPQN